MVGIWRGFLLSACFLPEPPSPVHLLRSQAPPPKPLDSTAPDQHTKSMAPGMAGLFERGVWMKRAHKLGRRFLGAALFGLVRPKKRRALWRRAVLAAAVAAPILYLQAKKRGEALRPGTLRGKLFAATQTPAENGARL